MTQKSFFNGSEHKKKDLFILLSGKGPSFVCSLVVTSLSFTSRILEFTSRIRSFTSRNHLFTSRGSDVPQFANQNEIGKQKSLDGKTFNFVIQENTSYLADPARAQPGINEIRTRFNEI